MSPLADSARANIFSKSYDLILQGLRQELGRDTDDPQIFQGKPLTTQELLYIREHPFAVMLGSRVAMAQEVMCPSRPTVLPAYADGDSARSRLQARLTGRLFEHMLTVPSEWRWTDTLEVLGDASDGFALLGATAVGKTIIKAAQLRACGIGLTYGNAEIKRVRKAMIIAPTIRMLKEFAGLLGDGTFRDFLGDDISVSMFYSKKHDTSGDVVLTTLPSSRLLDWNEYDVIDVDEGHRAHEPQFRARLQKATQRVFLFTATPAYSPDRDLRNEYRHVEETDKVQLIEQKVLNPTRLLSFRYEKDPVPLMAMTAIRYLQAGDGGRRIVAFCRPKAQGSPDRPAETLANTINELMGFEVAASVGSHNPDSERDEKRYVSGDLRVLATCKHLMEGANIPADVGLFEDPSVEWRLDQQIGRLMRPGKYMTELAEFFCSGHMPKVNLCKAFGLEAFEQEVFLVPGRMTDEREPGLWHPRQDQPKKNVESPLEYVPVETWPAELRNRLADTVPSRTITIADRDFLVAPASGFVQAAAVAQRAEVPLSWLHSELDRAGLTYEAIWTFGEEGNYLDRWYEPGIVGWLEQNPIPDHAKRVRLRVYEIAALCDVSVDFAEDVLRQQKIISNEMGVTPQDELFGIDGIVGVERAVDALPLAAADDVLLSVASAGTAPWFVTYWLQRNKQKAPQKRRLEPDGSAGGVCRHITQEDWRKLSQDYRAAPLAIASEDASFADIARLAGVTIKMVRTSITEEDWRRVYPRRHISRRLPTESWDRGYAESVIVARIKADRLGAHLVPLAVIAERVGKPRELLRTKFAEAGIEPQMRKLGKLRSHRCFGWAILRQTEEEYGLRKGVEVLDYNRLPRDEYDLDPKKWVYAQFVQKQYIDPKALADFPVIRARQGSSAAPAVRPESAKHVRPSSAPAPSAEAKQVDSRFPVNISLFLQELGFEADPLALRRLAKRIGVDASTKYETVARNIFGTETAAMALGEALEKMSPAPEGALNADQIAAFFNHPDNGRIMGIQGKHVAHIAAKLAGDGLEGFLSLERERRSDGSAGRLALHFNKHFSTRLIRQINVLRNNNCSGVVIGFKAIPPSLRVRSSV
ncbi:MAG TPA: hypothetical protein VF733_01995 [Candidatus Saccharimonadales bacterium]